MRTANPMDHKMRLAREIVAQFHSESVAREAEERFDRTFRKREMPEDVEEWRVSFATIPTVLRGSTQPVTEGGELPQADKVFHLLPWVLKESGLAPSMGEARRLIGQGAVEIDARRAEAEAAELRSGSIIRVGKHRFLRIVDADS